MPDPLRIVCGVRASHPELLQDLAALDQRDRPERLRVLATLGLMYLRHGLIAPSAAVHPGETQQAAVLHGDSPPSKAVSRRLARNMASSFSDSS
ncbi:hypothetical protein [Acidithiobacillus ferridurans]|uniref:Uncharacterized protein n=1 Tax=Acidithiobacillus ferridurans TaxID=1232575 RepID=A0A8X8GDF0_ACIFI|nr:hypothetical protein [Acidithiobacillus ferridurans]MBU2715811.1 hypothetical protein [Acidithiobacillus ferridurans]MBU2722808.1 hypothetical protein [Acidithiobacillus ferridurans]MBU2727805.1 hypothetical protein [Acidithiobacillus ferridurans]